MDSTTFDISFVSIKRLDYNNHSFNKHVPIGTKTSSQKQNLIKNEKAKMRENNTINVDNSNQTADQATAFFLNYFCFETW